ncbi:Bis(5'-nucleosyl)-tetraphosphatase (asymmetrical) [hydrothermal vent metagenome]|uniref:Bis(5'-nucleosyl)-tetraphosphatase (Asymmetrical) n=1 Tax=hydrothermal vent metagenome TaxID=652676 RepID=A0A3B0TZ54_9ZZZZ
MSSYERDNIFAKILRREIPAIEIFDDHHCMAIMDVFPQSKGHALIIPKVASRNILDADPVQLALVIPYVQRLAIASKKALKADGIKVAQFNESAAGQTVFHLHWHIIPVYEGVELTPHAGGMADAGELAAMAQLIRAEMD